ncbi:MAG: T9SS type A sorting domain-containing protein, partial [Bacteroidales bacterium]|nr:T9SS type A sorting domain-containing protein [Bacteroidales bacterium]
IQHSGLANESMDAYAQTVCVYPLPATDKVTVVALDPIQKIEIYNMAGMLVKVANMNESVLNIDVTSLVPGAYIAKITTENGVASKKLVVK